MAEMKDPNFRIEITHRIWTVNKHELGNITIYYYTRGILYPIGQAILNTFYTRKDIKQNYNDYKIKVQQFIDHLNNYAELESNHGSIGYGINQNPNWSHSNSDEDMTLEFHLNDASIEQFKNEFNKLVQTMDEFVVEDGKL